MRRRFLIAYDIRNDYRLRQVHDVCEKWGDPLQYSVWVCDLDRGERAIALAELREEMNLREDSVVVIDLGEADGRGADCFQFIGYQPWKLPTRGATVL